MAKLPSKNDIHDLNKALEKLGENLDKLSKFRDVFKLDPSGLDDIENKLNAISAVNENWGKQMDGVVRKSAKLQKDLTQLADKELKLLGKEAKLRKDITDNLNEQARIQAQIGRKGPTKKQREDLARLSRELTNNSDKLQANKRALKKNLDLMDELGETLDKMPKRWNVLSKLIAGGVVDAFDRLGKSIIDMGLATFSAAIWDLERGIKAIYEMQERWTKATGSFNKQFGAAGATVDAFNDHATRLEGFLRDLTGEFGMSFREMNQFVESFGFADKSAQSFADTTVLMGRALGTGTAPLAELTRTFSLMGMGVKDVQDTLVDYSSKADIAGVTTAKFTKEMSTSRDFLARFGRTYQSVFTAAATYAMRLGLSLKSLQEFTQLTDNFDSATEAAAKLNTVFGTTISSLDLMLEQDPAKRFEMVRNAIKGQGRDLANLNQQEKVFLASTMKISQEELNAILTSGKTYSEIQKDVAKSQKQKVDNEKWLNDALEKTRETLISWQLQWDKVTTSVMELIKPLTDMLGLSNSAGKRAAKFGDVMANAFDKLAKFIRDVANNPSWQRFMGKVAEDFSALLSRISDLATSDQLGDTIKTAVKAASDFYDILKKVLTTVVNIGQNLSPIIKLVAENIKPILAVWGIGKVGGFIAGAARGGSALWDLAGGLQGKGGFGGTMGRLGSAGVGGLAGAAGGAMLGGALYGTSGAIGGSVGGALGGALGSLAGPIGTALGASAGSVAGAWAGKEIAKMLDEKKSDEVKDAEREKAAKKVGSAILGADSMQEAVRLGAEAQKDSLDSMQRMMRMLTGLPAVNGSVSISGSTKERLTKQIDDMIALGIPMEKSLGLWARLSDPNAGPVKVTMDELNELAKASDEYVKTIDKMSDASNRFTKALNDSIEQGSGLELKQAEADFKQAEAMLAAAKGRNAGGDEIKRLEEAKAKAQNRLFGAQTSFFGAQSDALALQKLRQNPEFQQLEAEAQKKHPEFSESAKLAWALRAYENANEGADTSAAHRALTAARVIGVDGPKVDPVLNAPMPKKFLPTVEPEGTRNARGEILEKIELNIDGHKFDEVMVRRQARD